MALVVEDGTGLANSDAFITLAYFNAFCAKRGKSVDAYHDGQREEAIVRATDYLSESIRWKGFKVRERGHSGGEQALAWPRQYVEDRNGYTVATDEVPSEVQRATAEIAFYELGSPFGMQPVFVANDRVKRERFDAIEFEYSLGGNGAEGARPVLLAVRDLIGEFVDNAGGSTLTARAVRA